MSARSVLNGRAASLVQPISPIRSTLTVTMTRLHKTLVCRLFRVFRDGGQLCSGLVDLVVRKCHHLDTRWRSRRGHAHRMSQPNPQRLPFTPDARDVETNFRESQMSISGRASLPRIRLGVRRNLCVTGSGAPAAAEPAEKKPP